MASSDRILTLDIGASKLVLAEFKTGRGGSPELVNYAIGSLGMEPEADQEATVYIASTIRDMMRDSGIRPAPVLMTVSGQSVFPRYVKLPPVTRDKIYQMVRYEAEQNVPFPMDEVVWDYQLIGGEQGGEMNVMLVASKTEVVTKLTDAVMAAGLEPETVDVATMALYNIVRFNYPTLEGCTMVLDIGARSSNLIFVEQDRIFSRSIPVAGNAITQELMKEFDLSFKDAEEMKRTHAYVAFGGVTGLPDGEVSDRVSKIVRNVVTRLHAEVNRSVNFYRGQQGGDPPALVLLTGGSSIIRHMDTFFTEKLKVPVEYLNPFVNISVAGSLDADRIASDLHLLGEVAGLALRRSLKCPIEINLMPKHLVEKKVFRKRQPFFILSALGVVLSLLCWWVYTARMNSMFTSLSNKAQASLNKYRATADELGQITARKTDLERRATHVTDLVGMRTQWLRLLGATHELMPDGMWITAVTPLPDGDRMLRKIEIKGMGFSDKMKVPEDPNQTQIDLFKDKLRASGDFSEDTQITSLPIAASDAYAREFTIVLTLRKPLIMGDL